MNRRELQALCKRHGLPAGGTNAGLLARLDAALSGVAGTEGEMAGVAAKKKGCLKQTAGDAADAKKVTFAPEEGKARRLRSRVIWSPVVSKTWGKSAQASTNSAAAEDSISAEVGADVPVRRSRRKSVIAAEAEEVGEAVAVDRKRKRKNQENDDGIAVSAQVGVSSRVTIRSSLAGAAAVLPPAVQKKRGRGKAAGGSNELVAEAQDIEPDVQKFAQVEVSARITRSRATAPAVMAPTVVENKRRRKTIDSRTNVELPTVADVPRNDAPVTRSLRSRVVHVNNSMVDETHTARQLENKTQPSRPPTRRHHQQVSSSVEDKNQEQTAAPKKAPILRCSGRNHSEDAEKQPEVKEPVKRSTRKSVVLATFEKEENDLNEEKNHRRSMRKSIVPVKDIKGIGEKIHNANREDAVKQPATKGPVRGLRSKSVVPEFHDKEKGLIAEKNMEAHEGKSMRKPVMPVNDIKTVGEGIQNAKGKDVEKQFVVKQPTRRSSRKSVLPDMLENNSGLLAAEMNVRRSTRKSVLPNMLNEENQGHNKMVRNENFQSGECQDDERQQKVKEPIRRSRRSVAAVLLEGQNNGIYEGKISKIPMRRSTRRSVARNELGKVNMDDAEIVAWEPERFCEEGLKLRKHRRSSLEISSSANDSWKMEDFEGQKFRKQQNAQIPDEKDNMGGTQQASNSTTSKGRSSKRRQTTASEEVRSVKEVNNDIIIREATKDAHKATDEYKESGSRVQESGQVNVTREEHSSGPLLVTLTVTDKISTVHSVPVVIPGPESGDNANESSDKSMQEHSDIQAVDSHSSETSAELDQSSCIAELVLHNFDVSEDRSLMSKESPNGLSTDFTVGDREEQSPVSREGRLGLEANASEPGENNLANVMSTGLNAKILQHDTDIIAKETDKDVLPMAFPTEEHGEKYMVSPLVVEKSVGWEASACLQHDCDVLTKETGEASGAAPPILESDTNPENQCNAEESIQAVDLGKCPSRVSKGNPYSGSLHLEGGADDCNLPVLNADKGCSSDGRPSSLGLELMFAEACKERYSKNVENTVGDREEQSPISGEGRVGLEANASESGEKNLVDIMSTGIYAKSLQHDTDIIAEETDKEYGEKYAVSAVAVEMSVGWDTSACESAGKPLTGIFSNDLHTKHLQHDCDVLTKEAGEASGAAPPMAESDTNPEIQCNAEESIRAADLGKCPSRVSEGNPYSTSMHLEGAAADCNLPVLNADEGCSSDGRPSSFGLELMFAEACKESYSKNVENTVGDCEEESPISREGRVGLEANASESGENNPADIMSTGLYAKSLTHDIDIIVEETVAEESIRADLGKCPSMCSVGNALSTSRHLGGAADDTSLPVLNADKGCSSDGRPLSFDLELMFAEECKERYSRNTKNIAVEIDGGNKPSTPVTSSFHVLSDCLEDEDVQPTECDADKKLDVDEGVAEEDFAEEKSNDQHVPAKTDLNMKLNDELTGPGVECITEKNARHVADNLYEQAIILVQQGDVQEGGLKKPSPCSTTPVCKQEFGLPEATVLPPKNNESLSSVKQSPFGLESLFSHENIDESIGSATAHTKNGFDDSKDCHVKSALENHDTEQGICKNDDCMRTSQQDNGIEGSLEANLDEERVLSVYSLDAKHIKEVIDFEEVACEGEGSKTFVHSEELKASSEKTNVNGLDGNACGTDAVLSSALHTPAKDNYEICLGSNTDVLHQGHNDQCSDDTEDIIEDASGKYIERGNVLLSDAIENEGPLTEEAACTMKNYAGTCSSNPRDLLMELQSLFSKGNTKESDPHDSLAFPSAENSGDESINVEQQVKLHHSSDLSHLDELIGCSNTEVLCQGHNHKDRSNVDRVGQIASEPCTNDIVEASATAKCIESGMVLPPYEKRSNLNDFQLNPKLESPNIIVSGLSCDKDVCNTSDNGSVVVVGERTPSGSGLPEDYPKDHYPRQELLDGFSVESSLQGTIFGNTIVSGVAAIGNPSSSLATPDYKYEGALSEEAVCRMKNYTGTSSVDPRHLVMDLQFLFSEGSTEKSDLQDNLALPSAESGRDERIISHVERLDTHVSSEPDTYQGPCQDLSRHEEKETCVSVPMQVTENGGFLRSSHMKGSLTSVQIDLADDAHLIERDIAADVEVLCEEKVERESMPISDIDILQEKSYSNAHGICQSRSQKHIAEANSRISSCCTEVLPQDHKEECNKPNEDKFSPKALVENNMTEDAPIEGMESSIMLPLVAGPSEIHDEQLNTKTSDESEELSFSCHKDTIENVCTGPAKGDLCSLPKDFHIVSCQEQEVPEVLSLPKSPEESAKFQCASVSGSGPCQQRVNESTSMQVTYNIDETVNQDHEEYNQNNEDQTTPGVWVSSVPEAVEMEIEQSELEIGLIPATETSVSPVPDEQPNIKLEGNQDKITPGIPASSLPEAVEIEQSEMEIGLIPAAETSVLPVPDKQPNSKLEGNKVDYDKDFFILSDSKSLKREASNLHKDECMDLSSEDNHPNDLPAPRSPEQSYFQNDNDSGSVGICQSSRQTGIGELRAKLQSFKVSSTVKGSYIAMSAPRPKPGDSMSQSAIALLRNIENTPAVKAGHPVKPNADGKDSSRRALQPISGRPREH